MPSSDNRTPLQHAVYLAEHLFQMIDRETWRATGGDDGQGHYEGDYRAEKTYEDILRLKRIAGSEAGDEALSRIALAVEAWDNDQTPDEDFPFSSDADFVNFCGHVARAALRASEADSNDAEEVS